MAEGLREPLKDMCGMRRCEMEEREEEGGMVMDSS